MSKNYLFSSYYKFHKFQYPSVYGIFFNHIWHQLSLWTFLSLNKSKFKISIKKLIKRIFEFSKTNIYLALRFLPNFVMWWNVNKSLKSHITCLMLCVTCHKSLMQTATATDPTPANSPTMHNRFLCKDQQPKSTFFLRGNFRPQISKQIKFLTPLCSHCFFLRNPFVFSFRVQKLV